MKFKWTAIKKNIVSSQNVPLINVNATFFLCACFHIDGFGFVENVNRIAWHVCMFFFSAVIKKCKPKKKSNNFLPHCIEINSFVCLFGLLLAFSSLKLFSSINAHKMRKTEIKNEEEKEKKNLISISRRCSSNATF